MVGLVLYHKITFNLPFLLMIIGSMIVIIPQSPVALAGMGGYEDKDNDGFSTFQGDCDDNNPNIYPGMNCDPEDFIEYITEASLDLEENGYISPKQLDGLLDSLQKAVERLDAENYESAAGALTSYRNKINSYVNNGTIPEEVGQPLIDQVQMLIDAIK